MGSWQNETEFPELTARGHPPAAEPGRTGVGSLEAIPEAVESGQYIRAQAAADRSNLSKTSADG